MASQPRRRDLPNPGFPSVFQQLSVLPPLVKALVGPALFLMGVSALVMLPDGYYSWVLFALGALLGIPLGWQGVVQHKEHRLVAVEITRASAEMPQLQADLQQAASDKRGVERLLLERGYTTAKARRWIALECGVVLPVSSLY